MHGADIHGFDEAANVADAPFKLIAEVENLLGAAKAKMIGREHMIALRQNIYVLLPCDLRSSAEFGGVQEDDGGTRATVAVAGLQIMRPDSVDGNVAALAHSAATRALSGRVRGRSFTCG